MHQHEAIQKAVREILRMFHIEPHRGLPHPKNKEITLEVIISQHLSQVETTGLVRALDESLKLQSHYATLLNMHDGGSRMTFASPKEWIERLQQTGGL